MTAVSTNSSSGARRAASRAAPSSAPSTGSPPRRRHRAVLIATAQAYDDEMLERIVRHQADRAERVPGMRTIEEPIELARAIVTQSTPETLVVVDCLTLWLTNLMMPMRTEDARPATRTPATHAAMLLIALREARGPVVLVGNEIGLGVIPLGRETRAFVDALGRLNQEVAAACHRVTLMAAGLPLTLKAPSPSMSMQKNEDGSARAGRRGVRRTWRCVGAGRACLRRGRRTRHHRQPAAAAATHRLAAAVAHRVGLRAGRLRAAGGRRPLFQFARAGAALPQVGGGIDPNVEAIVALKPDAVLLAKSSRVTQRLEALGVKVLVLEPKNHADVQRVLDKLDQVLGTHDAPGLARDRRQRVGRRAVAARERRGCACTSR
jgi:adenosylcobinamide kinase/adenosylcobinamide-phosphate guanylyltransferase